MKTRLPLLLISFACIIYSCKKDNPSSSSSTPTPPPATDSLGLWEMHSGPSSAFDIWFTDAKNGCLISGTGEIYRSSDSGKTWQQRAIGMDNYNLFFYNSQYGYDVGYSKIAITKDGGNTWASKSLPISASVSYDNNIFFVSPSTGYLSTAVGLYKTYDTCNTWHSLGFGNVGSVYFLTPAIGYITVGSSDTVSIWQTTDSAASFRWMGSKTFTGSGGLNVLQFTDSASAYFTFAGNLYKTTDTGHTILPITTMQGAGDVNFFNATTGYVMNRGDIYYTNNGGVSFTKTCKLANNVVFNGMYFLDANTGWAIDGNGLVLRFKQ